MNLPSVSIGLPVYNGERHLRRALDSILAQDFTDFELILSDNASTDATPSICRAYAERDTRVRFHRNETNIGAGPNHNQTFQLARGRFFSWAAHDIEFLPGMLGRCFGAISRAPETTVLVYPRCELIGENGAFVPDARYSIEVRNASPPRRLARVVSRVTWVTQLYGLARSSALRKTRLIDAFAFSDYVLLAELAMLGEIQELPEVGTRRWLDAERGAASQGQAKKWAVWLDPAQRRNTFWVSRRERLAWEYARSAWRVPAGVLPRLACLITGPSAFYWRTFLRVSGPLRRRIAGARVESGERSGQ